MVGSVYILLNSTMPGYLKIGMTTSTPEERARELSQATGVAVPYSVAFAEEVINCEAAESLIHARLAAYRVNNRREFFHLPLRDAIRELSEIAEAVGRHIPTRCSDLYPTSSKEKEVTYPPVESHTTEEMAPRLNSPKSGINELQTEFWRTFPPFEGVESPDADTHRAKFPIRPGGMVNNDCYLEAQIEIRKGQIRVALVIQHPVPKGKWNDLQNANHREWERLREDHEAEIKREAGTGVYWVSYKTDQKRRYIKLDNNDFDLWNRDCWPDAQRWLLENLRKFRGIFSRILHSPCGLDS